VTLAQQAGSAVLWRGFGLSIEKVIFLFRILILARILAPADFGLVAIGMVSLAVMTSLTDFGIVPALIQQPAGNKRHLDTAWTIGLVRGAGINIIMLIAAPFIAHAFGEPEATNIIRLLAVTTLLQAGASIEVAALARQLKFKQLALIRLSAAVCNTIVSVLLARSLGAWAIVWGTVAGAITNLIASYVVAPYRPRFRAESVATSSLMRFRALDFRDRRYQRHGRCSDPVGCHQSPGCRRARAILHGRAPRLFAISSYNRTGR
jgi:PST family polysaccharide transporter